MSDSINVLTDLETLELTLCRRGKNKKRFALSKSDDHQKEQQMNEEILKAILEIEAEKESDISEIFKQMSEKGQDAVKGALRLLSAYREEMPEDLMKGLANLLNMPMAEEQPKEASEESKKEEQDEEHKPMEMEDVPEEMQPKLKALWKEKDELAGEVKKLQGILKAERDERERREWIQKSEEFSIPSKTAEQLGGVLKIAHDLKPELAEELVNIFKACSEVLENSQLLDEIGKSVSTPTGVNSAWEKIEKEASRIVEKSGEPLTQAEAIDRVLSQNPKLYQEYLTEQHELKG